MGPNDVWGGPNGVLGGTKLPKKSILSMQRHRHNVKTLHRLEGAKSWFQSLWEGAMAPGANPAERVFFFGGGQVLVEGA